MAVLKRDQVVAPAARREIVPLPSLGGDVIVRDRMLADRLSLGTAQTALQAPVEGESDADRNVRVGAAMIAKTLSLQVVLEDDTPVFTAQEWALHGASHPDEALALYNICQRLSGVDMEAVEKNSQPSPNGDSPSSSQPGWVARFKSLARA